MNYELAKELQDAGFETEKSLPVYTEDNKTIKDWVPKPTLSELIEACGDEFVCLDRIDAGWNAVGHTGKEFVEEQGKTPEEAVARLWLEVNKK